MTRQQQLGWGLAGAGVLWWLSRRGGSGGVYAFPSYLTGQRVTRAEAGSDGFVHVDPAELARTAAGGPYHVEILALARFLGSEYSSGNAVEKAAIGWTILNRARKRGWSILRLATTVCCGAGNCYDSGRFGRQEMPDGCNRYAATSRDASDADVYVSTQILAGRWPDPTQGGDAFFDPRTQARLHLERPSRYRSVPDLLASWGVGTTKSIRSIPGVDPAQLIVIGPRLA